MIRPEDDRDWSAVRAVHEAAFPTPAEARLVDALRDRAQPVVSLVAEEGGSVVGHVICSPVRLSGHPELRIMGLGPMAVAPEHQRRGIGTALVDASLEACRRLGFGAAVVVGHPDYYPRFGFSPAARVGIGCDYDVPEEAFLLTELEPGHLAGARGTIHYHPAFDEV